jgi:glycosyltransferase involved in cell wall biosynthesis
VRVAHVTSTFVPNFFGGREVYVLKLSEALAANGVNVSVLTGDTCNRPQEEVVDDRIRVLRLPMHCLKPVPHVSAPYPLIPSLSKYLVREAPDIIHAHDYYYVSSFNAELLSLLRRRPFVLTIHGFFHRELGTRALRVLLDLFFGRLELRLASRIICVSNVVRRSFLNLGLPEGNVMTIYPGVDIDFYAPVEVEQSDFRPLILSVGRVIRRKGIQFLIRAVGELSKSHPKIRAMIVGPDGGYRGALEEIVEKESLSSKIRFLGPLPEEELREQMAEADMFVLPSLEEQMPEAMLRAMAMGKPVVASNVGGVPEAIHDGTNGLLVEPGEVTALTQAIDKLIGDQKLATQVGRAARVTAVEKFSLRTLGVKMTDVYADLLNNKCN